MSVRTGYPYPVSDDAYETEPTDEQIVTLLRGLWHYATAYEPKGIRALTVGELIDDLLRSADGGGYGMTRDEWVAIGSATGVPV